MAKEKVENEKLVAILSYFFPIGLIWYFADEKMKKSEFAKFHVKQSLVLVIAWIIWSVVFSIIGAILAMTSMGMIVWVLSLLGWIPLIFWIIGIINAANLKQKELPIIGGFAKKFKF